jgi:hypothetical protein
MAIVPNRPAALRRRVTTYSLVADVVLALIVGLAISHIAGLIIFIIGLVVTVGFFYNFTQVMRNRGIGG